MKKKIFVTLSSLWLCVALFAQFELPTLPYSYDALEPCIDSVTMRIHYRNHHASYVNNLNDALKAYPELQQKGLEELLRHLDKLPVEIQTAVRNNGGGHYNHTLFWQLLTPAEASNMPATLKKQLEEQFGSVENFKSEFEKAATKRFGSGWVWLIKTPNGSLQIVSTPNQDNPIMPLGYTKGEPILCLDVWEHAYYLKYQSKRADYVKNFWKIVNWQKAEELREQ